MTIKRLLPLALMALPFLVAARPAYPGIIKVTNPDGTTLELRGYGDEKFNYYTDAEGAMIYECDFTGTWKPAVRFNKILTPTASNIDMLRAEVTPVRQLQSQAIHKMAEISKSDYRTTYPTISEEPIRALVILLEFKDTPFTVPNIRQSIDDMLNKEGYNEYGARGSARDYYLACSNNKFNVHFDVSEVVPLQHTSEWYMGRDLFEQDGITEKHRRWGTAIKEALEYLDARGYDFSVYDYDNNKDIDNIFFYYSGFGQADSSDPNTVWPHQGSYQNFVLWHQAYPAIYPEKYEEIWVDGVRMRTYACSNELNHPLTKKAGYPVLDGIGAFCHEYAHVLGLPDMYDTANSGTRTPGEFSIMASGSYNDNSTCPPLFSSYEQWLCRWLETEDLYEGAQLELPSISLSSDPKTYRIMLRRPGPLVKYFNEWFFIESRSHEGWDEYLPEEGIFIWRIDYTDPNIWSTNTVNSLGTPRIELMTSYQGALGKYCAWPGKMNATYSHPGSSNAIKWSTSTKDFEIWLSGISFDEATKVGKLGFNTITSQPDDVTVLHENPGLVTDPDATPIIDRRFILTWDPVEGATDYLVSVTRTDSRGITNTVDGYDEKPVGNKTSVIVSNMSATAWKQDYKATVRVVKGIPSTRTSNEIHFKPTELTYSSVDGIVADGADIFGGEGCVIAPEGAEVYNLSGVKTGAENLPAGVYIVRYGQVVKKVFVK